MRMNAIIQEKPLPMRRHTSVNRRAHRTMPHACITLIGCVLMIFGSHSIAAAKNGFIPWNSEVRVADENLTGETRRVPNKALVYNGPQGGAWLLIRFFQVAISPQDGPSCGFNPVCSLYGRRAVERHGAIMGLFLAFDRVLRCNPFNAPGADPVPQRVLGP